MSSDFYDTETVSASFNELKKLLEFLEKLGAPHPAITGGWAVYAYEKASGSRDIDLVMTSEADIVQHLYNNYFPAHNFKIKKIGLIPDHYEKIVQTTNGPRDVIVDIFNGEKKWEDNVNLAIEFQWGWTLVFQEKRTINGLEIWVPKRELLLITKMMAAVARSKDYDITGHYRLPPKIKKDYQDVALLSLRNELDLDFYKKYMKESKADQYIDEFLRKYKRDEYLKILEDMDSTYEQIESVLKI